VGRRGSRRFTEFYEGQVENAFEDLTRYYSNQEVGMTKDRYYELMHQLGKEPNEDEVPVEISDLPICFQNYVAAFSYLPDNWDAMGGNYLGKDLSCLNTILDIFEIEDRMLALRAIKELENIKITNLNAKKKKTKKKNKK